MLFFCVIKLKIKTHRRREGKENKQTNKNHVGHKKLLYTNKVSTAVCLVSKDHQHILWLEKKNSNSNLNFVFFLQNHKKKSHLHRSTIIDPKKFFAYHNCISEFFIFLLRHRLRLLTTLSLFFFLSVKIDVPLCIGCNLWLEQKKIDQYNNT